MTPLLDLWHGSVAPHTDTVIIFTHPNTWRFHNTALNTTIMALDSSEIVCGVNHGLISPAILSGQMIQIAIFIVVSQRKG